MFVCCLNFVKIFCWKLWLWYKSLKFIMLVNAISLPQSYDLYGTKCSAKWYCEPIRGFDKFWEKRDVLMPKQHNADWCRSSNLQGKRRIWFATSTLLVSELLAICTDSSIFTNKPFFGYKMGLSTQNNKLFPIHFSPIGYMVIVEQYELKLPFGCSPIYDGIIFCILLRTKNFKL